MIQFPCGCGQILTYPESDAGREVQCPHCGLLNDVPRLSDLQSLNEDGTFKIDSPAPPSDPNRLDELAYVFRKGRVDEAGDEIDLRNTPEELAVVGQDAEDEDEHARKVNAPQYDPETGELVRPLGFREERPDPRHIPMVRAVGANVFPYASPGIEKPVGLGNIALRLFLPQNMAAMVFIFIAHVLTNVVLLAANTGIGLIIIIAPFVLIGFLFAHYGNVIDEIGREEGNMLPRPLRSVNMYEDFWLPAAQVMGALMLSFGPALVALIAAGLMSIGYMPLVPAAMQKSAAVDGMLQLFACGLFVCGALVLPAVLLTTTCSGSVMNLRPDRIIGAIGLIGATYWSTAFLTLLTLFIYFYGIVESLLNLLAFCFGFDSPIQFGFLSGWLVTHLALVAGVYLAHLVCWRLGLIYQQNQSKFPWVFQQFERERELLRLKRNAAKVPATGVSRAH